MQSYQLHLKCPSFCDHHSPFPDSRLAEHFSRALCFKEQAEVLRVFLAWCLQPLAASSVRQGHPGEH